MEKIKILYRRKADKQQGIGTMGILHFDFRTPDYKRLSENTIIQEFGEVWREMKVAGEI